MAKTVAVAESKPGEAKMTALTGSVERFRGFLGDVRSEMRKVVAPSRKEVQTTTVVVLAVVFFFAAFFYLTDTVFAFAVKQVMDRLVGS